MNFKAWILATTLSPCTNCCHLIRVFGFFHTVLYLRTLNHDMGGIRSLRTAGITVEQI